MSEVTPYPQGFIQSASGRPSAHRSFLFCRRYLRRRPLSWCKRLDPPPAFKDQGRRKTQHPAVAKTNGTGFAEHLTRPSGRLTRRSFSRKPFPRGGSGLVDAAEGGGALPEEHPQHHERTILCPGSSAARSRARLNSSTWRLTSMSTSVGSTINAQWERERKMAVGWRGG